MPSARPLRSSSPPCSSWWLWPRPQRRPRATSTRRSAGMDSRSRPSATATAWRRRSRSVRWTNGGRRRNARNVSIEADFALARYALDGRLAMPLAERASSNRLRGRFDEALGVAIQADGKIVVVGRATDDIAVARYEADGDLDASFSRNGKRVIDLGGVDAAFDVHVQADGRIVVAGTDGRDFAVLRLRKGGSMDAGFGVAGVARTGFGGFPGSPPGPMAIDAADRGWRVPRSWTRSAAVTSPSRATTPIGPSTPTSATPASRRRTSHRSTTASPTSRLRPRGIVASGRGGVPRRRGPGLRCRPRSVRTRRLARCEIRDAGTVRTDFGSYFDEAEGMALQADGRIVVAGPSSMEARTPQRSRATSRTATWIPRSGWAASPSPVPRSPATAWEAWRFAPTDESSSPRRRPRGIRMPVSASPFCVPRDLTTPWTGAIANQCPIRASGAPSPASRRRVQAAAKRRRRCDVGSACSNALDQSSVGCHHRQGVRRFILAHHLGDVVIGRVAPAPGSEPDRYRAVAPR